MTNEIIQYRDDEIELEGFVSYPSKNKLPLVILCHAWRGRDDFICEKTQAISKRGYIGFALDMYGKGVLGKTKEENALLKKPFTENRYLLQKRVLKGFETAINLPFVDPTKVVVLGYGFGGMCALDLARAGVNLKGAISVYGHFDNPPSQLIKSITAKVLIIHGYNDPISTQKELNDFEIVMNHSNVDWQTHVYGNTMHAFATPGSNDPDSGILYNQVSAERSWIVIQNFLDEVFTVL